MTNSWANVWVTCIAAVLISRQARQVSLQSAISSGILIYLLGAASFISGTTLSEINAAPSVLVRHTPWLRGLECLAILLASRGTFRLVLRPWHGTPNFGLWLIGGSTLLSLALQGVLDSYDAVAKPFWIRGILFWPLVQIAAVPWFIRKRPGPVETDWIPLICWWLLLAGWSWRALAHGGLLITLLALAAGALATLLAILNNRRGSGPGSAILHKTL